MLLLTFYARNEHEVSDDDDDNNNDVIVAVVMVMVMVGMTVIPQNYTEEIKLTSQIQLHYECIPPSVVAGGTQPL